MKVFFALLILTFCLAGTAQAITPPAVDIFGPELYRLMLMTGADTWTAADKDTPWIDGKGPHGAFPWVEKDRPWTEKPPRGNPNLDKENPWGEGKGPGPDHPWD